MIRIVYKNENKALVIERFRVQYDQYFPSFSYFAHEKYLLFVTVIQHLSKEENTTLNFFLQVIIKIYF